MIVIPKIVVILGGNVIVKLTTPKSETTGRLLTPEEGCGFTKVKNNRIVGGSEAKIGIKILLFQMINLQRLNSQN